MKKRILSLLLVMAMIMSIFTGCGNSAETSGNGNTGSIFQKTITISEMLNSIIEDEGECIMYRVLFDIRGGSEYVPPLEDLKVTDAFAYDGNYLLDAGCDDRKLDVVLNKEKDEFYVEDVKEYHQPYSLDIYVPEGEDETVVECLNREDGYFGLYFGNFTRMEIDEVSCMVFETYEYSLYNEELSEVYYTIIKDTEYTKDKVVVFDSPSSESVTLNKHMDYVTEYRYKTAIMHED